MTMYREVGLALVDLGDDLHPRADKRYHLLAATDARLAMVPVPDSRLKRADLSLLGLYLDDVPDFEAENEAILLLRAHARDPEDLKRKESISTLVPFGVTARGQAAGTGMRVVFRNLIFQDTLEVAVRLVEVDASLRSDYERVRSLLGGIEPLAVLDPFLGMPLVGVATRLAERVVETYGGGGDRTWGSGDRATLPPLDTEPGPGGAFLRSGIYVAYEQTGHAGPVGVRDLFFEDGRVLAADGGPPPCTCLAFSLRLRPLLDA